jgi:hypothetical protein
MLTRDNGEVESESDKSESEEMPSFWWIVVMRRWHILLRERPWL